MVLPSFYRISLPAQFQMNRIGMRQRYFAFVGIIAVFCSCFVYFDASLLDSSITKDAATMVDDTGSWLLSQESPQNLSSSSLPQQQQPPPLALNVGTEPLVPETTYLCSNNENYLDYDFRKKSGIFCIITGIEHSGTTMVSSLLMNAPNVYGAFELGLLLAPTPQQFNNKKHVVFSRFKLSRLQLKWGLCL